MKSQKNNQRSKPGAYIIQFGTGTNINLLPLAAGQLYASLKADPEVMTIYNLHDILFERPADVKHFAMGLENPKIIGFSCFLWSNEISLAAARTVREYFQDTLIVLGGPAIAKGLGDCETFLREHPFVDVVVLGEGEDVFRRLCLAHGSDNCFDTIPGIVFREPGGRIVRTAPEGVPNIKVLPSPYLDGSFDNILEKTPDAFSGVILETNRGCPYRCAYCTWGNQPVKRIREKPMDIVAAEIDWIGRKGIGYIAMSDANFGIRKRDEDVAVLLAECKKKYGVPNFVSVSWVKDSSKRVLRIGNILGDAGIGYRVTLSLQSLNPSALKAVNRANIDKGAFEDIKKSYRRAGMYSYTELILGLPEETLVSYLDGLEKCLSNSVRDQLYIYPCLLFPNTILADSDFMKKYGTKGSRVPLRYTKSKEYLTNEETVEIVIGTDAMPKKDWRKAFVLGYALLGLHDDRLAFFILHYLRDRYKIPMTGLIAFAWDLASEKGFPVLKEKFGLLDETAHGVQEKNASHLVEPAGFNGIPFDPPEGFFLEMLLSKKKFFTEFHEVVATWLNRSGQPWNTQELDDLFAFQNAVIAHPDPPGATISLRYNWPAYFGYTFQYPSVPLIQEAKKFTIVDDKPSNGDPSLFLKKHFDIRGVPPFNRLLDHRGRQVFPPLLAKNIPGQHSLTSRNVNSTLEKEGA